MVMSLPDSSPLDFPVNEMTSNQVTYRTFNALLTDHLLLFFWRGKEVV